jgi:hypothetical protein
MKIIAKVDETKFFCEIDKDELANVLGYRGTWDMNNEENLSVGSEVNLARVIKAAHWLRTIDENHLIKLTSELNSMLAGVEKVKDTAHALNLFNMLAEVPSYNGG